ncbi:MAG: RNA methyltransferase [Candidatus Marinimicrobia bacterium]|nr:RNA methyltransferase [Candidatus Neomarinimicrobiota bacterium]MCF7850057.1 RNA methyltransferase [Candidatus Neomarinimicrobiota bacterium]MCF7904717.1 RNA methyltransferase [Candidatus Neomarinimicrobiota bacterium]
MISDEHKDRLLRQITEKRLSTIQRVLANRQRDLTVVIENIHDPHNVGAIFRSADAVGIEEVQLLYTKETFPALHPKVTASGGKWVKQNQYDDPLKLVEDLRARNYKIYTTHLDVDSVPIHNIDWTQPSAIVLGNENRGVSAQMTEFADQNILIPMFGMVESLNVSVATAVILFEACRQRLEAGEYPQSKLDGKWFEEMADKWARINHNK